MSYRDFQTEVYHAFREIGNAIICFQLMEQSMMTEEVIDLVQSMPFQGIIPTTVREGEDAGTKRREAAERAAYMRFVSAVQSRLARLSVCCRCRCCCCYVCECVLLPILISFFFLLLLSSFFLLSFFFPLLLILV